MPEPSSTLLIAAGALALAASFAAREMTRVRHRKRLVAGLTSPVAATRIAAAETLIGLGPSASAKPLLGAMDREEDPGVRMAVALTVGRRQWEPGSGRRATALRSWAGAELLAHGVEVLPFGPAFTRLSDMGGPRLPKREPGNDTISGAAPAQLEAALPEREVAP